MPRLSPVKSENFNEQLGLRMPARICRSVLAQHLEQQNQNFKEKRGKERAHPEQQQAAPQGGSR
jgi:hypothetical protein